MGSTTLALCLTSLSLVLSCGIVGKAAGKVSSEPADSPIVLPLTYAKGHLFVTLREDGLGTLSMLVDTGTERTTIAKSVAGKEKLHTSFWNRTVSQNGYGTDPSRQEWRTVPVALR